MKQIIIEILFVLLVSIAACVLIAALSPAAEISPQRYPYKDAAE